MRITRIDFEGQQEGHFAIAARTRGSSTIKVNILLPECPEGLVYDVAANNKGDIYTMAQFIQCLLDGGESPGSEVDAYYQELLHLSDI